MGWFGSQKSEVRSQKFLSVVVSSGDAAGFGFRLESEFRSIFKYHGHARWSGPWDNPNIAGLLMGVGVRLRWQGVAMEVEDGKLEMQKKVGGGE